MHDGVVYVCMHVVLIPVPQIMALECATIISLFFTDSLTRIVRFSVLQPCAGFALRNHLHTAVVYARNE